MPRIAQTQFYNGFNGRIERLGLRPLWAELERVLTDFSLLVREERDTNGGAAVRVLLDEAFRQIGGWTNRQTGDVDWIKCLAVNGTSVCMGVEVQFSSRSDMLIIDVDHLRQQITEGKIDVGVIVVPSDRLATFLTDRAPYFAAAVRAVERSRAHDLPLAVLGLEHDGPGPALPKRVRVARPPA